MFKDFIKQDMSNEIYGIVSLCIFVVFFAALIVYTISCRKSFLNQLSQLPLEGNDMAESSNSNLDLQ